MSLLIVDSVPDDLELLRTILTTAKRWQIVAVHSCEEALQAVESGDIELVLTDLMNPPAGGLEVCRAIKAQAAICHVPVVMMMDRSERTYLEQAYEAGALDYIMKPLDADEVVARVRSILRSKEEIDRRVAHECQLETLTQELKAANQQLVRLSAVDALTGIANRRCFDETLDRAWRSAARHQLELALIMIDIDFFKAYNDYLGHPAGDECLRRVAQGLKRGLKRPDDFVARYGGEEFAVILPRTDLPGATVVGERLRCDIAALAIVHPASRVADHVTVSQGLASALPARRSSVSNLVAAADEALYDAKRLGRNRVWPSLSVFVGQRSEYGLERL